MSEGTTGEAVAFKKLGRDLGFEALKRKNSSLVFTMQRESKQAITLYSFMRDVSLYIFVKESSKKIMHVAKSQPGEQPEEK